MAAIESEIYILAED